VDTTNGGVAGTELRDSQMGERLPGVHANEYGECRSILARKLTQNFSDYRAGTI
jgi:hypothetical protein